VIYWYSGWCGLHVSILCLLWCWLQQPE